MSVNSKKETISKILVYLGSLIGILIIFLFILPATELRGIDKTTYGAKMISWMLGTNNTIKTAGMSILFILEILIAISCSILLVISVFKQLPKKVVTISSLCIAGALLICAILSFCTKNIICNAALNSVKDKLTPEELEKLMKQINHGYNSKGPILYGIFALIGFATFSVSVALANLDYLKKLKTNKNINNANIE